ncbi:MAG: winged helix-turn-helix domain-containing protein [Myxococcota bacterium]
MDDDRARLPEQRVITDLAALKVMANPLRVRLLQLLADRASSVKELAAQLGEGQTKLYRHIEQMAHHGFIEVVRTRTEGGPEQRCYRATARSFVLDTSIFHDDEPSLGEVLSFVFDTTRADIRARVRDGTIDLGRRAPQPRSLLARRCLLHLDSAQADHYYRTLAQLAVDVADGTADEDARQGYALAVAFYPTEPEAT